MPARGLLARRILAFRPSSPTRTKAVTEITLPLCQAQETVESGLRLGAVGNFISIDRSTVLSFTESCFSASEWPWW